MNPISVDPKTTSRAQAFELWMNAPNPMVTFFKTLDVSPLVRLSHRRKLKFNMLLCWCVGKAASEVKEFFLLPVGGELLKYDSLAVNTIVKNKSGEVSSCDVPFNDDIEKFNCDYLELTSEVAQNCQNHDLTQSMVIGTSAIIDTEIDGAVGMNSGIFNNPFMIWGKYRRRFFKTTLTVSFQFHHTQMDGAHAGRFLELLQQNIKSVKKEFGKNGR
ncbi:CatA-like O-acetyltransferase, family 2 [uncultured Treponema sp.]|uniref:CatA-like O-acetyltransferase, family 2 n=1 Tax=Treponema sp. TaxID=166 RepID=UPI0025E33674|nr:CatA-like O-acetyltransferase, family 2 [uncultured Treponema sp.]MEE0353559.1 CatA-like O-acetyltransferase, family 2 [Treponema sp.]